MIDKLNITNYKSIKRLNIRPKRLNVFIGEHNSGKSNVLEALSWLSINILNQEVNKKVVRFDFPSDLFYDFDTSDPVEIITNDLTFKLEYEGNTRNVFLGIYSKFGTKLEYQQIVDSSPESLSFVLDLDGKISNVKGSLRNNFRYYQFKRHEEFHYTNRPFLNPPFGDNIPLLLFANKALKEMVSSIFKEKGFRLIMKPNEMNIEMAKDVNDELYSYPYKSVSETLQRIIFYQLAIESNKDAVLIMDEPESNTFPMYTKQLGELMALDQQNQYFIATHNPYLLGAIVAKTPVTELNVYVTKMENYQTVVYPVSAEKLAEMQEQGVDVFFNLGNLTMLS